MNGWEMASLRHRLADEGFITSQFSYSSMRREPAENAEALEAMLETIAADKLHLVGHSLGGLVIRYLFDRYPKQRPGRVVTLGTPHQGSRAAGWLAGHDWGRLMLGESYENGLSGNLPEWTGDHELGSIAGSSGLGLGHLVTPLPEPHDGTVAVAETHLPNAKDNLILPVNHIGMLLSTEVARQVAHFLRHGRFAYTPPYPA
jgi:pimeloyl-ACP methyl ester carboxylesterase